MIILKYWEGKCSGSVGEDPFCQHGIHGSQVQSLRIQWYKTLKLSSAHKYALAYLETHTQRCAHTYTQNTCFLKIN